MIAIGILLAVLGPILLLPIIWVLYRFATRPILNRLIRRRVSDTTIRLSALGITAGLLVLVLAATYLPGRQEFDRTCAEHGVPRIAERVTADGFFRTKLFAYEAHPFLEKFSFIEAPDPYKEGVILRYTLDGDQLENAEVTTLKSRYGVRKVHMEKPFGVTMTEKRIYELSTNRELARAGMIYYQGGPLGLLIGSFGRSACPDILSYEGSRDFGEFYDLETIVLGGSTGEE